jgi:tetrahydromethanopterin S-methyltransferase subunit G
MKIENFLSYLKILIKSILLEIDSIKKEEETKNANQLIIDKNEYSIINERLEVLEERIAKVENTMEGLRLSYKKTEERKKDLIKEEEWIKEKSDVEDKYRLGISFPAKMEEINKKVEFKEGLYKISVYFNKLEKDEYGIYKIAIGKNGKMYLFPKDEASAARETLILYNSAYEIENPGRGIIFIYEPALVTPDKNDPNELVLEKKGILSII